MEVDVDRSFHRFVAKCRLARTEARSEFKMSPCIPTWVNHAPKTAPFCTGRSLVNNLGKHNPVNQAGKEVSPHAVNSAHLI